MSDATLAAASARTPHRNADIAWAMTGLSLTLAILYVPGLLLDPRLLEGVGVWVKPFKFATSFVIWFLTIALVVDRLSDTVRRGWTVRVALAAMAVATFVEMAYITQQAGLGEASHFNVGDPYHAMMYTLMGVGAAVLVIAMGALGVRAGLDGAANLGPGARAGIAAGFSGSAVLTLVVAFTLGGNNGHFVGVPSPGAPVIPLFGWSAQVGDLRPAHFLSLHGMQVLPLVGITLDRMAPRSAVAGVALAAAVWAALTLAVFAQGLLGLPLVRL